MLFCACRKIYCELNLKKQDVVKPSAFYYTGKLITLANVFITEVVERRGDFALAVPA